MPLVSARRFNGHSGQKPRRSARLGPLLTLCPPLSISFEASADIPYGNFPSWKAIESKESERIRNRDDDLAEGRPRVCKRRIGGDVACGSWWRTKCRNRSQPIVRTARWRKGSNTFSRTRRTSVRADERNTRPRVFTKGTTSPPSRFRHGAPPPVEQVSQFRNRSGFLNEQCVPGLIELFTTGLCIQVFLLIS